MNRCSVCVMPDSRPDTPFINGVCAACLSYQRRPQIDWDERKAQLLALLDRFDGRVIVPSSGGKDSTYQVLTLLELGADVTIVTARTCHLTKIGRANIDNLSRYARSIEIAPNMKVRAKLNRLGLEMVGDISWPEHCAIFSTPFRVALETGRKLIMYGECPQAEYGGPMGSEQSMQMTRRWVSEFGGFLGLRIGDLLDMGVLNAEEAAYYSIPPMVEADGIEAHFLGQYIPWDSRRNAEVAIRAGMKTFGEAPHPANWWTAENLDNAQTGVHDFFAWLKFGYTRGTAQISVDVRTGNIARNMALTWSECSNMNPIPEVYAGVSLYEVLDRIEMTPKQFHAVREQFTNTAIHGGM